MNKNYLSIIIIFWASHILFAQKADLFELSQGELKTFHALFDTKDNVFGYFLVYNKGIIKGNQKEFEYILLDKNLRKVLSNTLKASKYISTFEGSMNYKNELIIYPNLSQEGMINLSKFEFPKSYKVNFNDNTLEEWTGLCFENQKIINCDRKGTIKDLQKDAKAERKKNGFVYVSKVYEGDFGSYLVIEYDDYDKYTKNFTMRNFDKTKNEQWKYTMDDEVNKKHYYFVRIIHVDSSKIYALKTFVKKNEYEKSYFLVFDMQNGKLIKEDLITEISATEVISMLYLNSEGLGRSIQSSKDFDNKIVNTGKLKNNEWNTWEDNGYFRCIIDKETSTLKFDKLYFRKDFRKYLPQISETGILEKGYKLSIRDAFFLENGSIIYIFEKYKYTEGFFTAASPKTEDLIFVTTDADFKISNVKQMDKEKSKFSASDYLFSQYLNDGKDFAFFYQDYKKDEENGEKNWKLYINTWIDGTLQEEQLPISSKENFIFPYVAKEGYILLREINEKEKYNQIRLEKLNF